MYKQSLHHVTTASWFHGLAAYYLSAECAIRKISLLLPRVMLLEPEIRHAWTRVYDNICGDSNLAFLTSCSANFIVTALQCTLNKVRHFILELMY
jgi:hypothetical protein